jgi:F-type H+-transporting ATPase subunit delta
VFVSSSASLTSGVAGRYATALFEIARSGKTLDKVESDLDTLDAALAQSADLRDLISSPVYTRDQQGNAMRAITDKLGLGAEVSNTVGLMALNRRLFVLRDMITQVKSLIAAERGEVTAEVISATPLTQEQINALSKTLKSSFGKDVKVDVTVDESLIGGLVVQVGSQMIDTSIRSKLANLQNVMKEVG